MENLWKEIKISFRSLITISNFQKRKLLNVIFKKFLHKTIYTELLVM